MMSRIDHIYPPVRSSGLESRHHRRGMVIIMVLLILSVAVMLAATFVSMMATYRASGTRQSARQIAAQIAVAGSAYAEQALMRDYDAAHAANVPQRYADIVYPGTSKTLPDRYAGVIPASAAARVGLDWKQWFEGQVNATDGAWKFGSKMVQVQYRANQYGYWDKYGYFQGVRTDPTRPTSLDSGGGEIPLQYTQWSGGRYNLDGNPINIGTIRPYLAYYSSGLTTPRWWTSGYYDRDFHPLEWTDRDTAAYEARFTVMPIPLDGNLSINFGDKILKTATGGRYRLGYRNPLIPPGTLQLPISVVNGAISEAKGVFAADAQEVDMGKKALLTYTIGSSTPIGVSVAYPYQAYQVLPTDTAWTGAGFPLAQQYGTALANMLGVMCVTDGGGTINVTKQSNVVFTGPVGDKYASFTVTADRVKTGGLDKASAGIGALSKITNIAMGQGFNGNFSGFSTLGVGDLWSAPTVQSHLQVGTPASWRQFHASLGYARPSTGVKMTSVVTESDRLLPIMTFVLSPFGAGLDKSQIPARNQGSSDMADIDCPWYVNLMLGNPDTIHAMICGMDAAWYRNFDSKNGMTGNSDAFPLNQSNLMPIPPNKVDPNDSTKFAVWDDGVARTGADGVEGGALPPLDLTLINILATGYKRPPLQSTEVGTHYFPDDAFAGNAPLVWKNPVHDETNFGYVGAPQFWTVTITRKAPDTTGAGATADVTVAGNAITGITITNGGSGYTEVPTVAISGNATGTATVVGGVVTAITITTGTSSSSSAATLRRGIGGSVGEDMIADVVTGGHDAIMDVENFGGTESDLDQNKDPMDERLSWQNDIVAALLKTAMDCHYDRMHGKKINGAGVAHGYSKIEDVEMVFLGHLGIAVRYTPATSKASTVGASAGDYVVHAGPPSPSSVTWPLGQMNQLWALSQLKSAGAASYVNEIGYDRGRIMGTATTLPFSATTGINSDGNRGQAGFRNYTHAAVTTPPTAWPTISGVPYRPTWAALSRILEHRLNDVRMSIFGTPALDLNQDGTVDATTVSGSGEVTAGDPQLHFSTTGRWQIGQNRYWRIFIKSQLWDRRTDTVASESALERVVVLDANGDYDLSDTNTLFSRWHANPYTTGQSGPTAAGRTEATLAP